MNNQNNTPAPAKRQEETADTQNHQDGKTAVNVSDENEEPSAVIERLRLAAEERFEETEELYAENDQLRAEINRLKTTNTSHPHIAISTMKQARHLSKQPDLSPGLREQVTKLKGSIAGFVALYVNDDELDYLKQNKAVQMVLLSAEGLEKRIADQTTIQQHILMELSQVKSSDALTIAFHIKQPLTAVFLALDTLIQSGHVHRPTPDQYALVVPTSIQTLTHAIAKLQNTADGRPQELSLTEAAELLQYIKNGGRWLQVRTQTSPSAQKEAMPS